VLLCQAPLLLKQLQHLEELHLIDLIQNCFNDAPLEAALLVATQQSSILFNLAVLFRLKLFVQKLRKRHCTTVLLSCIQSPDRWAQLVLNRRLERKLDKEVVLALLAAS